ncbi:cellulase family glycosylhydrolase [Dyadobacter sp. CY343]|uniref:cellulase family glycosylhydrolase n=1 Tax=Dyadobacter sp. CY343 TaxID=2907299 RepID=UPI001F3FFC61|nr:cellulase family glycosylhydrolase [Dyadobacter sp. CY343]MCE7059606.1 cellulase family glycosylhydrolase [Dyadobacter sp. CY343]
MKKYMRIVTLFLISSLTNLNLSWGLDVSGSITSSGKTRTFIFHAPGTSVPEDLPLLFVFHGDNGSGANIRNTTGFNATADANNFIVVYPNADTDGGGWHRAIDQTKDAIFTSDLIDYFCNTYHIDAKKVYATGLSAGGFMTYNLAVNLPDKIAAFAPVAANMYANNDNYSYFSSANFKPVPILHIHGDTDAVVSYPDPNHTPTPWNEWPLTQWSYYSCGKTTYTLPNDAIATNVMKLKFCVGNAPETKEVSMIRVQGVGHAWPVTSNFNPNQAIWDFVKDYSIAEAPSCAPETEEPTHAEGTIHSQGRNILGPCDGQFIPMGVNYSLADDWEFPANINGDPTNVNDELSAEIIKANPNTVRIQWYANRQSGWKAYSVADLDVVVTRFRKAGIVSVIELHDVTCSNDYSKFNTVVLPWWKQQEVLDLVNKHRGFVIVNVANEFGNVKWASNQTNAYTTWLDHYKNVISELRTAGIEVPIMIDAPDCGQSLDIALQAGAALKTQDPLGNVIMSAHGYWYTDNAVAMEARVQQIANATFPVVLGEIANVQDATGPCSDAITSYTDLLQSCKNHNVGWLAWTWTDDWCEGVNGRRISLDGDFTNLSVYGNTIIHNPTFGLAANAQKMQVACLNEPPLPVRLVSFEAKLEENKTVRLTWKTAAETAFSHFELERSEDGIDFSKIISINSGQKEAGVNYEYLDKNLAADSYYYRLKMQDLDGAYAYSKIASVNLGKYSTAHVFPSPAKDYIVISRQNYNIPAQVQILSQSGKVTISRTLKKGEEKINISELKEGLYIVTINGRVAGKVIVDK